MTNMLRKPKGISATTSINERERLILNMIISGGSV